MRERNYLTAIGACLVLAACDGVTDRVAAPSQDSGTELPAFQTGSYSVVLDGDGEARFGDAFIADDGRGFVLLSADSDEGTRVAYRRAADQSGWRRVPSSEAPPRLQRRLQREALVEAHPDPMALAGAVRAVLGETVLAFELAGDGSVVSAGTGCTAEGALAPGQQLGAAIGAELSFSGCGTADGSYNGIAWVDGDAPNAAFRLVLADGERLRDFYAFRF